MGFEQLNYNRYDLLQVEEDTFEEVIKLHELLKNNKNIVGFRYSELRKITS